MANTNTRPSNLSELLNMIQKCATEYGYIDQTNGLFRNCISNTNRNGIRQPNTTETNFWFGYIREDQPTSGAYDGFSFVIFPEYNGTRCLVSIGIGSGSIGKDADLATSPGFRRSFMRLRKSGESNAKFFFKLHFDEMETSTPGLQEELNNPESDYEEVMIDSSTKYNADPDKEAPGLQPAAFIVNYTVEDGWKLIKAWLAQYAKWRNWAVFKKGTSKPNQAKAIEEAIRGCYCSANTPSVDDIKKILDEHKYVILQGAPGCGKTWSANKVSEKFDNRVVFTQFHAETTYSDFVYGIRPTLNGKRLAYKGENGVLLKAINLAKSCPHEPVLLIIDEINRANLANVLGPVFYLFEPNAPRKHKLNIGTVYNDNINLELPIEIDKLPDNLYVLATMNTADKSLAVVDFALRRRFAWITLRPQKLAEKNFDSEFFEKVDSLFSAHATDEELNLQPGQSYFMDVDKRKDNVLYGLMPLMKEYFSEGYLLSAKEEFAQLFNTETGIFMYE